MVRRAEEHLASLKERSNSDLAQEFFGRASLERARWLSRSGKPASGAARNGLAHVLEALKTRPRDPELWVLRARLEALAGDPRAGRESLERAWAINPLVRGGPASHEAETLLATR